MKVLITMGGMGSRFTKIGFSKPKHEIMANGKSLFEWSMLSLSDFFDDEFIFITRNQAFDQAFIDEVCSKIGINNHRTVVVEKLTTGQAHTAMFADDFIKNDEDILIYNIDTYINEGAILKRDIAPEYHGYVPSFVAQGDKWSFVEKDENDKVSKITEKVRISQYGTIGLYYFKKWSDYKQIFNQYSEEIKEQYNEVYIAPMYQYLIDMDKPVYTKVIPSEYNHVLGTPEDIEKFAPNYLSENGLVK